MAPRGRRRGPRPDPDDSAWEPAVSALAAERPTPPTTPDALARVARPMRCAHAWLSAPVPGTYADHLGSLCSHPPTRPLVAGARSTSAVVPSAADTSDAPSVPASGRVTIVTAGVGPARRPACGRECPPHACSSAGWPGCACSTPRRSGGPRPGRGRALRPAAAATRDRTRRRSPRPLLAVRPDDPRHLRRRWPGHHDRLVNMRRFEQRSARPRPFVLAELIERPGARPGPRHGRGDRRRTSASGMERATGTGGSPVFCRERLPRRDRARSPTEPVGRDLRRRRGRRQRPCMSHQKNGPLRVFSRSSLSSTPRTSRAIADRAWRRAEVVAALDDDRLADMLAELPRRRPGRHRGSMPLDQAADILRGDGARRRSRPPERSAPERAEELSLMEPDEAAPLRRPSPMTRIPPVV